MGEISPWLPGMTPGRRDRHDIMRTATRTYKRKRDCMGDVSLQGWVRKVDVNYLMRAWNLKTRSQLVRAAVRHLMRQTQRGITHLDGPPVGYD